MPSIREIISEETGLAFPALLELRPHLSLRNAMIEQINRIQRAEGYRLVGSFEDGLEEPVAVAGFRTRHSLSWGHALYVDDFVTRSDFRGRGHGKRLMDWLFAEAKRLGCDQFHLDSGQQRHTAHRFYLNQGLSIAGYHFVCDLC